MFTASTLARTAVGTAGAALFATLCLGVATIPAAAMTPESVSKTVRTADLDLAHPAGRAVLAARIKVAAKAVCATGTADTVARAREDRCVKAAIAGAQRS